MSEITEEHVARFQAEISKKASAVRVNNVMGLLRYIMKVCIRRKLIAENPTIGVRPLTERQPEIDPLTREELDLALSKVSPHYRATKGATILGILDKPNPKTVSQQALAEFRKVNGGGGESGNRGYSQ